MSESKNKQVGADGLTNLERAVRCLLIMFQGDETITTERVKLDAGVFMTHLGKTNFIGVEERDLVRETCARLEIPRAFPTRLEFVEILKHELRPITMEGDSEDFITDLTDAIYGFERCRAPGCGGALYLSGECPNASGPEHGRRS